MGERERDRKKKKERGIDRERLRYVKEERMIEQLLRVLRLAIITQADTTNLYHYSVQKLPQ